MICAPQSPGGTHCPAGVAHLDSRCEEDFFRDAVPAQSPTSLRVKEYVGALMLVVPAYKNPSTLGDRVIMSSRPTWAAEQREDGGEGRL